MLDKLKLLMVNLSDDKTMILCRTEVGRGSVRRETIDGVEHIIVSSFTLPDDIVMNGALYPTEEIAKSFQSLEGTLAPVGHPVNAAGEFISATSPQAIHDFHAGAFNANVTQEDGRVHIEKHINVNEAKKTDRGLRLLERIEELETNDSPRPIHTSVAAFVNVQRLSEPMTNAAGDEYTAVVSDIAFDHDAILLDEAGAAQPHQGVGMAVNSEGKKLHVQSVDLQASAEGQSHSAIHQSVVDALEASAFAFGYIEELFEDRVIFWAKEQLFEVPFVIDAVGIATVVGIPLPVDREVSYIPVSNSKGDPMKDLIINALTDAGIETESRSDDELLSAYNDLKANSEPPPAEELPPTDDLAGIIANAMKPLTDKIDGLETKLNAADVAEVDRLAGLVANSGKFPGLDADSAKLLGVEKLKEMAANTAPAFGVSPVMVSGGGDADRFAAPTEMPN